MKSFIGNILFFAALILILARFLSVWSGTPFPVDLVTSDSMEPSLMKGDVVAWTPSDIDDIEVGDVVVFKSYLRWPEEKLLVHRVSEIKKDSNGRTILETKGDANEWPDQEGPHIPEPYIREENLMGKTLSIGQVPLKIPFVGYIGIWINDGIDMLSQPTSSKESMSYAGIFAPLTISSVVLVGLVFAVPERAKTIKQKIKLAIFGPKLVDLKKALLIFLVAYFVFFTMIHCFAFDAVTASVGVDEDSVDSTVDFGRIQKGTESLPKDLPLINPSVSPVKGMVFARGDISEHISKEVFELGIGESKIAYLTASASNSSINGSLTGEIMVYSSPFWILFPDDFMMNLNNWNSGLSVICLDFLTALFLTLITGLILASITIITKVYSILSIDFSWHHISKPILSKHRIQRIRKTRKNIKRALGKKLGWIFKTDLGKIDTKDSPTKSFIKPVAASLIVFPLLYIFSDELIAMVFAVFIAGVIAYYISCKFRSKIILTSIITMSIVICHMVIQSNLIILNKEQVMLETLSLSLGAIGIYLLLFGLLLIPLSLVSWAIVQQIRNLKERKEPLLILEGKCDL